MPAEDTEADVSVLVVSDDPLVREEARFGFPSRVTVWFALDSREAVRLMESTMPSVVVVDMQTGNAGGYSLTMDMAESRRLASIPILILLQRPQDAWLARAAGASAFRTKPLGAGRLARETMALLSPAR